MPAPVKSADMPGRRRVLLVLGYALALVAIAFYLVQSARIATNHTDGGLILTYIDDIANGRYPHYDFIDAYGPLNWPMPVLFYALAGQEEWGIRIWLLVLKLVIIALSYLFVRRLAGTLYGVLVVIWMTLLYGQPWQSLQTAYGFNNVIPYVLGCWYFLICRPLRRDDANLVLAGVLTGAAIWVKLNAGMLVLLGGLFYCWYWLPAPAGEQPTPWDKRWQAGFRAASALGLILFALFSYGYLRRYFNAWYFVYLVAPLWIGLLVTGHRKGLFRRGEARDALVGRKLRGFGVYFASSLACALIVLLAFTRVTGVFDYLGDLAAIFGRMHYQMPFPPVGVPDGYVGFNENFWPQLPWLLPLVFLAWTELTRRDRGDAVFGGEWPEAEARAVGLYMMAMLYHFNLYSRSDETHIFESMVVVPPTVLILLRQIEALCVGAVDRTSRALRASASVTLLAWGSTLFVMPGLSVFDLSTGDRIHPKLSYIRLRELYNPYVRDFSPDISDHHWDRIVDEVGAYIDSITNDGETILVLDSNRLIHILSNTRPVGGRYHYFFYLVTAGVFDRAGFERSVPPSVLQEILAHPPKVLIGDSERLPPLAKTFSEINTLMKTRYHVTKQWRHILVYERNEP
jgi:hypothetical protein